MTFQDIAERRSSLPTADEAARAEVRAKAEERSRRSLKPLSLLRPYVLKYKGIAVVALIALLLSSASTLMLPFAVREMIDRGFTAEKQSLINVYFAGLFAVGALLAFSSATRFFCVSWLGERVVADLRADVFRHLTKLSPAFYEKTHSGEIMSRLNADTTQIKAAVSTSVSQVLRNGVMFVGAVAMMMFTSLKLSLLVIVVIPLIIVPLILYGRTVRRFSRIAQDEVAASSAFASENLSAMRTMQAFTSEDTVANRYAVAVRRSFDAAVSRTQRRAMLTASAIFLIFGSIVGVLWYGAHDVMAGLTTGGVLAQFVLYAVLAAASISEFSEVFGEMQSAAGAAERLSELISVRTEIESPARSPAFPGAGKRRGDLRRRVLHLSLAPG